MSSSRGRKSRVFPSRRFAAVFALGSLWFFAVPWIGDIAAWLGAGYVLFLLILAVADYLWLRDSRSCAVKRNPETMLSLGEMNPIHIEVSHKGERLIRVIVRDEPPLEFEISSADIDFNIQPGRVARVNYKVRPLERGDYIFNNLNVRFGTPIGLLFRQQVIPQDMVVKVYPNVLQTKKHLLLARENRIAMMGLRKSRLLGQGQEFERLRDYVPDDSLRYIDWKATARRASLVTREYDVEQSQNIIIALDLGRTMASRTEDEDGKLDMSKADYAINAGVLLAHVAAGSDDRVGLYCFAKSPISYVPPGKGVSQAALLLDSLYALHPRTEESDYYESLLMLSQKQKKRALIFLFTDLIDPESSRGLIANIGLLATKHLVVCAALSDYELPSIVNSEPANISDIYTKTVALSILRERNSALAQLAGMGVITLDASPADLSIATVNKYLQLKRKGRL